LCNPVQVFSMNILTLRTYRTVEQYYWCYGIVTEVTSWACLTGSLFSLILVGTRITSDWQITSCWTIMAWNTQQRFNKKVFFLTHYHNINDTNRSLPVPDLILKLPVCTFDICFIWVISLTLDNICSHSMQDQWKGQRIWVWFSLNL
jgi:hypothetical protein